MPITNDQITDMKHHSLTFLQKGEQRLTIMGERHVKSKADADTIHQWAKEHNFDKIGLEGVENDSKSMRGLMRFLRIMSHVIGQGYANFPGRKELVEKPDSKYVQLEEGRSLNDAEQETLNNLWFGAKFMFCQLFSLIAVTVISIVYLGWWWSIIPITGIMWFWGYMGKKYNLKELIKNIDLDVFIFDRNDYMAKTTMATDFKNMMLLVGDKHVDHLTEVFIEEYGFQWI